MTGLLLACDPGARAGYCVLQDGVVVLATHLPDQVPTAGYGEAWFEAQHSAASMYRNGRKVRIARKSQSTLSFTAGRLFERFSATGKFRIMPDDWRAILWPGARRLPKPVVLARLEAEYGHIVVGVPKTYRADVLEAVGIAMAASKLTPAQTRKYLVT